MDVFYPENVVTVLRRMMAFFCWSFGARLGWRYADFLLGKFRQKP